MVRSRQEAAFRTCRQPYLMSATTLYMKKIDVLENRRWPTSSHPAQTISIFDAGRDRSTWTIEETETSFPGLRPSELSSRITWRALCRRCAGAVQGTLAMESCACLVMSPPSRQRTYRRVSGAGFGFWESQVPYLVLINLRPLIGDKTVFVWPFCSIEASCYSPDER